MEGAAASTVSYTYAEIPAYEKYMTSKCSLRVVFSDFWSKEKIISSNYRTNQGHQPNYKNTVYSLMHKKTELTIFKKSISKKFRKQLLFLPVINQIICLMKVQNNFGKNTILKI